MSAPLIYFVLGYITLLNVQSFINASPDSANLEERNDYTYTPGIGAHKVHTNLVNWNEARRTCQKEGAHLAIMNSVDEVEVVSEFLEDAGVWQASVGIHDIYDENEWVTIHDEPLEKTGFKGWLDGEPSNGGGYEAENCGALRPSRKLNDVPCSYLLAFICELIIV